MRLIRRWTPGRGLIEHRVPGEEMAPRRHRSGRMGRKGEMWFNPERNRVEARGMDGKIRGMELPKGD